MIKVVILDYDGVVKKSQKLSLDIVEEKFWMEFSELIPQSAGFLLKKIFFCDIF